MQHHDAITGTHVWSVGKNYKEMMVNSKELAMSGTYGVFGKALKRIAKSQGFEI